MDAQLIWVFAGCTGHFVDFVMAAAHIWQSSWIFYYISPKTRRIYKDKIVRVSGVEMVLDAVRNYFRITVKISFVAYKREKERKQFKYIIVAVHHLVVNGQCFKQNDFFLSVVSLKTVYQSDMLQHSERCEWGDLHVVHSHSSQQSVTKGHHFV